MKFQLLAGDNLQQGYLRVTDVLKNVIIGQDSR